MLPVVSTSLALASVSVWPEAMSSVPLRSELTVRTFPVPAVKPAVTLSVPPPKITSLPDAPRLFSALICTVPALTKTFPLKVFAPLRTSRPASPLDSETTPSPASP